MRGSAARLESAARFGGMEWSRTAAFAEEVNTQPGVWINLAGREAAGAVTRADYERVRRDVIDALLDWKLDATAGGDPVVTRALPREELYDGPFTARAPDVVLELGHECGYLHSLVATPWDRPAIGAVRTLADDELAGGRGRGMNGTHRRNGIWLATDLAAERPASIAQVAAIVLRTLAVEADSEMGGDAAGGGRPIAPLPYSAEEEARSQHACERSGIWSEGAPPGRATRHDLAGVPDVRRGAERRAAAGVGARARTPPRGRFRDHRGGRRLADGSAAVVEGQRRLDPRVRLLRHPTNIGYGAALRSGLRAARGDFIFFTDADLQFDLREIETLLAHTRASSTSSPATARRAAIRGDAAYSPRLGRPRARSLRTARARHRLRLQGVPPPGPRRRCRSRRSARS